MKWDLIVDHNGAAIDETSTTLKIVFWRKATLLRFRRTRGSMKAHIEPAKPQLELKGYAKFMSVNF